MTMKLHSTGNHGLPLRVYRLGAMLAIFAMLAGCEAVAVTMLGVGAGVGAGHQLGGMAYRTFSEPLPRVKKAAMVALRKMAIKVEGSEKTDIGEVVKAKAADRSIELEFEALTSNTTRMRAVARKDGSLLVDSATAVEIITQTEKVLGS